MQNPTGFHQEPCKPALARDSHGEELGWQNPRHLLNNKAVQEVCACVGGVCMASCPPQGVCCLASKVLLGWWETLG